MQSGNPAGRVQCARMNSTGRFGRHEREQLMPVGSRSAGDDAARAHTCTDLVRLFSSRATSPYHRFFPVGKCLAFSLQNRGDVGISCQRHGRRRSYTPPRPLGTVEFNYLIDLLNDFRAAGAERELPETRAKFANVGFFKFNTLSGVTSFWVALVREGVSLSRHTTRKDNSRRLAGARGARSIARRPPPAAVGRMIRHSHRRDAVGESVTLYNLLYHEAHSTDVVFGHGHKGSSLAQIVSQISATTLELVKPVINSGKGQGMELRHERLTEIPDSCIIHSCRDHMTSRGALVKHTSVYTGAARAGGTGSSPDVHCSDGGLRLTECGFFFVFLLVRKGKEEENPLWAVHVPGHTGVSDSHRLKTS
ncbi:hypothetical protein EVAR_99952_1 [Eumeta japonica]|uniref:Uncharacterized protein n=1 Tax=Eumeta variegata TaxID=151549 RepID=A0A4C1ZIN6_EUMVA|nr:hypothetical protein EVAR_99952_1 [Eumeta japonica]